MPGLKERDRLDGGSDGGSWDTNIGGYDFDAGEQELKDSGNDGSYDWDAGENQMLEPKKSYDGDELNDLEGNNSKPTLGGELNGEQEALRGRKQTKIPKANGSEGDSGVSSIKTDRAPLNFQQRFSNVAKSRGGKLSGAAIGGITIFIFAAIGMSTLDTANYTANFEKKGNSVANRVLQRRRVKSITNAFKRTRNKITEKAAAVSAEERAVAEAARVQLAEKGISFTQVEGSGELSTMEFTDSAGTKGSLNLAADDFGGEVDRFLREGGANFTDEFFEKVKATDTMLGEVFRGPTATNWLDEFHISLSEKYLERANEDPNATPEKQLQDDIAHQNDDVRQKATVEGESGFKDPNENKDTNTKSPQNVIEDAQKQAADNVDALKGASAETIAATESAAQVATESIDAVDGSFPRLVQSATPELVASATEKSALAGVDPLIVAQQACKAKGAIDVVNHVRRYAYAIELIRFGMKWLAFADARKAGYASGKANALMELYMHRPNPTTGQTFGNGGAMANAFGNKSVHASSSSLSRYSVGNASAGILAEISNFVRPFSGSCKVANNTWLNIGVGIVGVATLIFQPEVSVGAALSAAGPILAFVVAQEIITKIATPILIRTGAHLVMSGLESGDILEAAVTSGVMGGMSSIDNAHKLTPVKTPRYQALLYDTRQYEKRQLARASLYERYINPRSEDSLFGHMAVSVATSVQSIKTAGLPKFFGSIASSSQKKLARSIFPSSYAATDTNLCQDPQVISNDIASDDFCNVYNTESPNVDIPQTQRLLYSAGEISDTGAPTSDGFKNYIKQCASGSPGLLYENDVKSDGGSEGTTDMCIDQTSNPLPGETVTIAAAFDSSDLVQPKLAWWQKAVGASAYAAPGDENGPKLIGRNVRYSAWLGYLDDISDTKQTLTNNFDNSEDTTDTTAETPATGATGAPGAITLVEGDTTDIPCAAGTDIGVADGYRAGKRYKIRLCNVQKFEVNSQVSKQFDDMLTAANAGGLSFIAKGFSGAFRSMDGQIAIYQGHCKEDHIQGSPPPYPKEPGQTIRCKGGGAPGYSNHQMGLAADFGCNGVGIPKAYDVAKNNPCWQWLEANAGTYGFFEYGKGKDSSRADTQAYEGWHWSVDGN